MNKLALNSVCKLFTSLENKFLKNTIQNLSKQNQVKQYHTLP